MPAKNLGDKSNMLNQGNVQIAQTEPMCPIRHYRPLETGSNVERQILFQTMRVSEDLYSAVAIEIKQTKPNIWKLQVRNCFS